LHNRCDDCWQLFCTIVTRSQVGDSEKINRCEVSRMTLLGFLTAIWPVVLGLTGALSDCCCMAPSFIGASDMMLALKIIGIWFALSIICAPVLIPMLARRFSIRNERMDEAELIRMLRNATTLRVNASNAIVSKSSSVVGV
jgi:hypothetical protein